MKAMMILTVLFAASMAQAESKILSCTSDSNLKGAAQFSMVGSVTTNADGKAQAQGELSYEAFGRKDMSNQLDIAISGSAKIFAAGQLMNHEVKVLNMGGSNTESNHKLNIVLGGEKSTSTLSINGVSYKSTCVSIDSHLLSENDGDE